MFRKYLMKFLGSHKSPSYFPNPNTDIQRINYNMLDIYHLLPRLYLHLRKRKNIWITEFFSVYTHRMVSGTITISFATFSRSDTHYVFVRPQFVYQLYTAWHVKDFEEFRKNSRQKSRLLIDLFTMSNEIYEKLDD